MARELTSGRPAAGCRRSAAPDRSHDRLPPAAPQPVAARRATQLQLHPAGPAAPAQTATGGWRVLSAAASAACRTGSGLFCLERAECVKHQLDDAVVPKRAERDQLTGGSNNDPEGRVVQKFHSATGVATSSLWTALRCFVQYHGCVFRDLQA